MGFKKGVDYAEDKMKPLVGLNFRLLSVRSHYVWNVLVGLNFSANSYEGSFGNTVMENNNIVEYRIKANYSILRIPLSLEYLFLNRKVQPFIFAGVSGIFIIKPDYKIDGVYSFGAVVPDKSPFRKFQYGVSGGMGIKYNVKNFQYLNLKSSLEFRQPSTNARYFLDYHKVYSLIISLGYGFKL